MTVEEQKQLLRLLGQLEPGYQPLEVFLELARIVALPILELVPVRRSDKGVIEVLLLKRETHDSHWPGELHVPGTVIRATDADKGMDTAFQRIYTDELRSTQLGDLVYVGTVLHKSRRGTEYAAIYWCEVVGEPAAGQFFPASELPYNLMESQRKIIAKAVHSYEL